MLKSVVQLYQIIFVISLSLIYGYCTNWFLEFIKAKLKIKIMRLPNKNLTHTSWTNIGKIGNWPSNISIIKSLIHTEFKNRNKLDVTANGAAPRKETIIRLFKIGSLKTL